MYWFRVNESTSWYVAFFAQQNQSRSLLETDEADEAVNVTENKTWESLKWKIWEFGNENLMRVKWEKWEWKERMRENKWDFGQIRSSLGITVLYSRKWLEITIQRYSKV